jgi:hypothetical protein
MEEAQRRVEAIRRGEATLIDHDEVMRDLAARFDRPTSEET